MTMREFYEAIINANISEEITDKAKEGINAIDRRNASKASKVTEKDERNNELREKIVQYLVENNSAIGTDIATALDANKSVVIGLCGQMVKEGILGKNQVSIPKVGKRVAYVLAPRMAE